MRVYTIAAVAALAVFVGPVASLPPHGHGRGRNYRGHGHGRGSRYSPRPWRDYYGGSCDSPADTSAPVLSEEPEPTTTDNETTSPTISFTLTDSVDPTFSLTDSTIATEPTFFPTFSDSVDPGFPSSPGTSTAALTTSSGLSEIESSTLPASIDSSFTFTDTVEATSTVPLTTPSDLSGIESSTLSSSPSSSFTFTDTAEATSTAPTLTSPSEESSTLEPTEPTSLGPSFTMSDSVAPAFPSDITISTDLIPEPTDSVDPASSTGPTGTAITTRSDTVEVPGSESTLEPTESTLGPSFTMSDTVGPAFPSDTTPITDLIPEPTDSVDPVSSTETAITSGRSDTVDVPTAITFTRTDTIEVPTSITFTRTETIDIPLPSSAATETAVTFTRTETIDIPVSSPIVTETAVTFTRTETIDVPTAITFTRSDTIDVPISSTLVLTETIGSTETTRTTVLTGIFPTFTESVDGNISTPGATDTEEPVLSSSTAVTDGPGVTFSESVDAGISIPAITDRDTDSATIPATELTESPSSSFALTDTAAATSTIGVETLFPLPSSSSSLSASSSALSSSATEVIPPPPSSSSSVAVSSPSSAPPSPTDTTFPEPQLRTFDWDITWVRAAPDGFERPFVGINGEWPCPALEINRGDTVRVTINNLLGNETTAIHWHGIFQTGTNSMDGAAMANQCPVGPGGSFTYEFTVNQTGTYWYHAHVGGQYIDGLRGPLIIRDPNPPYETPDEEIVISLTDLYHEEAPFLVHQYLSPENAEENAGAEPVPNSALLNEARDVQFRVEPGKTYLIRVINMGATAAQYLEIDGHEMTIVEVDGVYTEPMVVQQLFVGVAQRYAVLVETKETADENYAIVAMMNSQMFDSTTTPEGQELSTTAWFVYDEAAPLPEPFDMLERLQPWDDSLLVPHDRMPVLEDPEIAFMLSTSFGPNSWGSTRAGLNGISYLHPKVPTLYTALSAPSSNLSLNAEIYSTMTTNPYILPHNAVIEVTINNHDTRAHPFHLHGHEFQLVARGTHDEELFPSHLADDLDLPEIPMRRDTVIVYADSAATIRFRADNPGVQLLHCHTEWHVEGGMTATFIEAPDVLRSQMGIVDGVGGLGGIPADHLAACASGGIGGEEITVRGNAAGNGEAGSDEGWLDLTGLPMDSEESYWGALVSPPADVEGRRRRRG